MHIPDGFVSGETAALAFVGSAGAIALCARRTGRDLDERQVPLMGVMAAFVFAAQMVNFAVAGGTSGHLLGGALLAIVLGPWAGTLVLTAVLVVQALLFQDGGLLALGANVFNMAVVGVWSGAAAHSLLGRLLPGRIGQWAARFGAAWLSVVLASIMAALELALSGAAPLHIVVPAMALVHALIGIGEGLITAAVLGFLAGARADLLGMRTARPGGAL